ncbi:MAG TPA: lysophospholipid acyltransferase family protein [Thermodesulfobacteriota bacterium]|nr:lysophospholipid acyltransferase family protein [Thermodesulfobacteriota bacterium]
MLRTVLCWVIFAFMTVILGTVAILLSLFDSSGNIPHLVARLWGKIQLGITGTRVSITGLQNINPQRSYILVSNHQSNFDIFALLGYLPIQFRWIAKAELFHAPFMGWAMYRIGYIPIERESPKKAYRSMLKAAEAVNRGISVMIFPEGTRSLDGKLQSFKKGLFLIALKSQAPILPITIQGTARIMRKGDWRTYAGKVQITIDPPIETAGIPTEREEELSQRVRRTLEKNLANT